MGRALDWWRHLVVQGTVGPGTTPVGRTMASGITMEHMAEDELEWLPEDGVSLTRAELSRLFRTLRALIAGTDELDANRAYAVDIAVVLTRAIERSEGGS